MVKMNKRIILKTVLVCLGIFLILTSTGIYFFSSRYELDTEKKHRVVIAATDIPVGSIITDEMVAYKTIKESGYFRMGKKFGRVIFLREFASYIKDSMVSELCDLNRNMLLSLDIIPIPIDEAVREVENRQHQLTIYKNRVSVLIYRC